MIGKDTFIFLDESGNMEFSPKSSNHVVVVAMDILRNPQIIMNDYWQLRHGFYINPPPESDTQKPYRNRRFHAAEDPQVIRDRVFDLIHEYLSYFRTQAIILEKSNVFEEIREDSWLYEKLYYYLHRSLHLRSNWFRNSSNIQLLIDNTENRRLRESTIKGIRKAEVAVNSTIRSKIYHTNSFAHPFLQLADYFCWAIYRKYEKSDSRSYNIIREAVENEWVVFKK